VNEVDQLTPRQRRIVEFIRDTLRERGYPPTVREIGEAVGLTSSSSVHSQLANLERKGLLHKDPTKPRTIGLSPPEGDVLPDPGVQVPLVGRIAAGSPVLASENLDSYLSVPSSLAGRGEHFALKVTGDSMTGAGIMDGDIVVVRRQDRAEDGDIVAALLPGSAEDEATVKRLRHEGRRVVLAPENPAHEPFEVMNGRILGVVVAVLRRL
jgi:repressor LexA